MKVRMLFPAAVALLGLLGLLLPSCTGNKPEVPEVTVEPEEPKVHPGLADPSQATEIAPTTFKVRFSTTAGDFDVLVTRAWSPLGADRFYNLVNVGYLTDIAFFRNIKGFMVQFGLHGDPKITAAWSQARIEDDPVKQSNTPSMLSFATSGKNSRTTQMFINTGSNGRLDGMGFSPFGQVLGDGMGVVLKLYNGYGEGAPRGRGPSQNRITNQGNPYLKDTFPKLDYLTSVEFID